jgi:hypothetical protein
MRRRQSLHPTQLGLQALFEPCNNFSVLHVLRRVPPAASAKSKRSKHPSDSVVGEGFDWGPKEFSYTTASQ